MQVVLLCTLLNILLRPSIDVKFNLYFNKSSSITPIYLIHKTMLRNNKLDLQDLNTTKLNFTLTF